MTDMSKEYAAALFMLGEENGAADTFQSALKTVVDTFKSDPDYVEFLSCPGIAKSERTEAIGTAFASLPEPVVSFLQILCERGRMRELPACAEEYTAMLQAARQTVTATVTSAYPLTDEEKAQLQAKLQSMSGKSVLADFLLDESLLGGVIVEMDGKVLDGSLRQRLKDIKEVMIQ